MSKNRKTRMNFFIMHLAIAGMYNNDFDNILSIDSKFNLDIKMLYNFKSLDIIDDRADE